MSLKAACVKFDTLQEFSQNPMFTKGGSRTPINVKYETT